MWIVKKDEFIYSGYIVLLTVTSNTRITTKAISWALRGTLGEWRIWLEGLDPHRNGHGLFANQMFSSPSAQGVVNLALQTNRLFRNIWSNSRAKLPRSIAMLNLKRCVYKQIVSTFSLCNVTARCFGKRICAEIAYFVSSSH